MSDDDLPWLTIPEAARLLEISTQAIRKRLKRGTLVSRRNNKNQEIVQVSPAPSCPAGGADVAPRTSGNRPPLETMVPASLLEALEQRHCQEIARIQAERAVERQRHDAELVRLDRAHKAASDALMAKVAALLVADRPRAWWRRLIGWA